MEVTIKDLEQIKMSPSLIVFLKAIVKKDDKYIRALNETADIWPMAKHLEGRNIIKIRGEEVSHRSFVIRSMKLINDLNVGDVNVEAQVDQVLNYFKNVTGKRISIKSDSNRRLIRARLKEYSVNDLMQVIELKRGQWENTSMSKYIRIETLFNSTKFQSYIGELDSNIEEVDLNRVKA